MWRKNCVGNSLGSQFPREPAKKKKKNVERIFRKTVFYFIYRWAQQFQFADAISESIQRHPGEKEIDDDSIIISISLFSNISLTLSVSLRSPLTLTHWAIWYWACMPLRFPLPASLSRSSMSSPIPLSDPSLLSLSLSHSLPLPSPHVSSSPISPWV